MAVWVVLMIGSTLPGSASRGAHCSAQALQPNESKAVGILRTIGSGESTYLHRHKRFATLAELVEAQCLETAYVDGSVHDGYRISEVEVTDASFEVSAEPVTGSSGRYALNITDDYYVRYTEGHEAPRGREGTILGGVSPHTAPN
jgi:hypothetical protein